MSGIGGFGNFDANFEDSPDFYNKLFDEHPDNKEHFIHRRKMTPIDLTTSDLTTSENLFEEHPENDEHYIQRRYNKPISTEEHATNLIDHVDNNIKSFVNESIGNIKQQLDLSAITEVVKDHSRPYLSHVAHHDLPLPLCVHSSWIHPVIIF